MATIHREGGLRFVIFSNDHEPAHVHVFGEGEAKIDFAGEEPRLISAVGLSDADLRRAMRIVSERRLQFLAKWRAIHG